MRRLFFKDKKRAESSTGKKITAGLLLLGVAGAFVMSSTFAVYALPTPPGAGGGAGGTTAANGAAKCAILDVGVVQCPSYLGKLGNGTCWYEDPGSPEAGTKAGWQKLACTNDLFKNAASPQVTEAEVPALTACNGAGSCDLVKKYIDPLIAVLAGAVGLAVTIAIVVGGIQYASSAGDPQKAAAAKGRIMNAIIALIGFFLLFAFLSWILPGGLLNNT